MIFLLTFLFLFLSLSFLGIGYFLTGKSKLHKKCGSTIADTKPKCGQGACEFCGKEETK